MVIPYQHKIPPDTMGWKPSVNSHITWNEGVLDIFGNNYANQVKADTNEWELQLQLLSTIQITWYNILKWISAWGVYWYSRNQCGNKLGKKKCLYTTVYYTWWSKQHPSLCLQRLCQSDPEPSLRCNSRSNFIKSLVA